MKFITIFKSQYGSSSMDWSFINDCNATDFVFIPPAHPVASDEYRIMAEKINDLISSRDSKTTNIWIGTPGITSLNYNTGYTASNLTSFLTKVYNEIDVKSKVAGAYMNQEAIYAGMDYNNVLNGSQPGNKQIRIMNEIRSFVKGGKITGTGFFWIPYYGYGSSAARIIKEIGHVADKVNIFDYCIIQPHYLFEPTGAKGNLEGVRYSLAANKVCYRDNVPVIASKVSNTQIGFEMECDINKSESLYNEYVSTFSSYKSKPHGFYWAGYGDFSTFDRINSFLN